MGIQRREVSMSIFMGFVLLALSGLCRAEDTFPIDNQITKWNLITQQVVRSTSGVNSQIAARIYALVHISQYKALQACGCRNPIAALSAHQALSALFPWRQSNEFDKSLRAVLTAANLSKEDIWQLQNCVTAAVRPFLRNRLMEGSTRYSTYSAAAADATGLPLGQYRLTPNNSFVLYPQLGFARGFVIYNPSIYDTKGGPPAIGSPAYNEMLNETQTLGDANQPNQALKDTSKYWALQATTAQPPGFAFNTSMLVAPASYTLKQTAKYFAVQAAAGFDAAIVTWYLKYKYNFWRPITAIRSGDPANAAVPSWLCTLFPVPAHPEYPSAHSTTLGSHYGVIAKFKNIEVDDQLAFTQTSENLPGSPKSFDSLAAAGEDAGLARIYAGVHFRKAVDDAFAIAQQIGADVYDNFEYVFGSL